MLLPTSLTNRRKFLERTALGAGSILFFPGLLASCTDHRTPDPDKPVVGSPVVGAENFDWNDAAKEVIVAGLDSVPIVGGVLSALTSIFWPGTDVWSQVKDRVEALVDQKISEAVYSDVEDQLKGLKRVIDCYLQEVKIGSREEILASWNGANSVFVSAIDSFEKTDYEAPLLGLHAQFVNLFLSLKRDIVLEGKRWGRPAAEQANDIVELQNYINKFYTYTQTTYTDYLKTLQQNTPTVDGNGYALTNEPWNTMNKFTREITRTVLDYAETWAFYDITKYPNGAPILLPRELYSDPVGDRAPRSNPINLPSRPTQGPTDLTVWGSTDGIDAVQLTYPAGSGPNGVTTTPRMGRQGGGYGSSGTTDQPYGGRLHISSSNPIIRSRTALSNSLTNSQSNYVYAMEFGFLDGTTTGVLGGQDDSNYRALGDWVSIPDHYISSIYINGVIYVEPYGDGVADCVVYGFKYLNGRPPVTRRALETHYITSPQELSATDMAQVFAKHGVTAALISDNLKAARQAYWANISGC